MVSPPSRAPSAHQNSDAGVAGRITTLGVRMVRAVKQQTTAVRSGSVAIYNANGAERCTQRPRRATEAKAGGRLWQQYGAPAAGGQRPAAAVQRCR